MIGEVALMPLTIIRALLKKPGSLERKKNFVQLIISIYYCDC
jgi:hypothetical protein